MTTKATTVSLEAQTSSKLLIPPTCSGPNTMWTSHLHGKRFADRGPASLPKLLVVDGAVTEAPR